MNPINTLPQTRKVPTQLAQVQPRTFKPSVAQPKQAMAPPARKLSVAPPVYRPQPSIIKPARTPAAPPVYRLEPKKLVQPKLATTTQTPKHQNAPPVYRPQPTPKVLQQKRPEAGPQVFSNHPANSSQASHAPAPQRTQRTSQAAVTKNMSASPAPRIQVSSVQPKAIPASGVSRTSSHCTGLHCLAGSAGHTRSSQPQSAGNNRTNINRFNRSGSSTVQRYLEDVNPDTYWNTIDTIAAKTREVREEATKSRWEKSGIEGKGRHLVDEENTVMSSAVVEWYVGEDIRRARTRVYVSGNPWTDFGRKEKFYSEKELTFDERDCAEPKVLNEVNGIIRDLREDKGIRVTVYLYSEFTPCKACQRKINQWLNSYPRVELIILAHKLFTFGAFKTTWQYDKCEGYYYLGFGVQGKYKEAKYKRPVFSSTQVTSNVSFAAMVAKK